MPSDPLSGILPLVRKLDSIYLLTAEERQAVIELPMQVRDFRADQDLVREGDRPSRSCLLLEGLAFRYKLVGDDGRRQIISLYVPGDMPDLMSLHLTTMDSSVSTLIGSTVAFVDYQHLRQLIRTHPRVGDALWRDNDYAAQHGKAAVLEQSMAGLCPHGIAVAAPPVRTITQVNRDAARQRTTAFPNGAASAANGAATDAARASPRLTPRV